MDAKIKLAEKTGDANASKSLGSPLVGVIRQTHAGVVILRCLILSSWFPMNSARALG